MSWNLSLSVNIVLGVILSLSLVSNKEGAKYLIPYLLCFYCISLNLGYFIQIIPLLILSIVLLSKVEIRESLIFAYQLVAVSATYGIVSIAGFHSTPSIIPDIFLIRDSVSLSTLIAGVVYLMPKHKDYLATFTFISFSIFLYSYVNPTTPFKYISSISLPFAALSLLPYLGMTIMNNHFEDSFAHVYLTKALKAVAKRLKAGGDNSSKYAGFVLRVLKLR